MLEARQAAQARFISVERDGRGLTVRTEKGLMRLQPYSDSIIRIIYAAGEGFNQDPGPSVIDRGALTEWSYEADDHSLRLRTSRMQLSLDKENGAISYFDGRGKLLTREPPSLPKSLEAFGSYRASAAEIERVATADGEKTRVVGSRKEFRKTLYRAKLGFEWSEGEALYGLGQQEEGGLDLRGRRVYLHQANLKIPLPFMVSTRGYGVLFNACSPMIFSDNEFGSYVYCEAVEQLDFFFIAGEELDDLVAGYRRLTGKAPLLPAWAFGYMQSQERYESQEEILRIAAEYREKGIPLDSIVLDWQYWEAGKWGQKSFDRGRFPDPAAMAEALHRIGVKLMISVWPNMGDKGEDYAEMKAKGFLLPGSEVYDAFSPEARALYWEQAKRGLFDHGIDAWWCDSSEPFTPEWTKPAKPEPEKAYLDFHEAARNHLDEEMTNAYPLMHARAIYEGQRGASEKRVVNLTRGGYAGLQRYGAICWSGDISAKWETLRRQIAAGLSFCASGLPYWSLDIGGFFVKKGDAWYWDGDYPAGMEDLGYRELYVRWLQFGAFLPLFRAHGTDVRRELWRLGEAGGMFRDSAEKFIRLRYRLFPYIYSEAAKVHRQDSTLLRLLAFDFRHDPATFRVEDQFMFGSALMACPVTSPFYFGRNSAPLPEGARIRKVYLPAGSDWYDFWTGKKLEGGRTVEARAEIDIMPLFVRAGSIIPLALPSPHTGAIAQERMGLRVYPGRNCSFDLYQDEGDSYRYEEGAFAITRIEWDEAAAELRIGERTGAFPGMPEKTAFDVEIVSGG